MVKEVDAKTGGYLTVKKRDPEYWFVRPLKEQELGYTDRPYSMSVEMSEPGVNLKWLKNNAPIVWSEVNCIKKDEGKTSQRKTVVIIFQSSNWSKTPIFHGEVGSIFLKMLI